MLVLAVPPRALSSIGKFPTVAVAAAVAGPLAVTCVVDPPITSQCWDLTECHDELAVFVLQLPKALLVCRMVGSCSCLIYLAPGLTGIFLRARDERMLLTCGIDISEILHHLRLR